MQDAPQHIRTLSLPTGISSSVPRKANSKPALAAFFVFAVAIVYLPVGSRTDNACTLLCFVEYVK